MHSGQPKCAVGTTTTEGSRADAASNTWQWASPPAAAPSISTKGVASLELSQKLNGAVFIKAVGE